MVDTSDPALAEKRQPPQARRSLSASDWEKHREIITRLYRAYSLKEVMSQMATRHNFDATARMFKTRIKQWHLNKNMKSHEMEALVRNLKSCSSAGEDPTVPLRVRGEIVPRSKVERFARRHKKDLGRGRSASFTTQEQSNTSSPSLSYGYTLISRVENSVEMLQPSVNPEAEIVTLPKSLEGPPPTSSAPHPPLPRQILLEPLVESPAQNLTSPDQAMEGTSTPEPLVGENSSWQGFVAGPLITSVPPSHEQEVIICRCKEHADACDRSQFAHNAEKCIGCQRYFAWTTNALWCVLMDENDSLCRCKWHDRACRRLKEEYDARKCVCCKGWFAFSEQADHLIRTPAKAGTSPWEED